MQFVELQQKHEQGIELLFSQLTGKESFDVDISAIIACKHCHSVVLEDGDKAIGFGALITYYLPTVGEVGKVEDVVIDENYRGQGLGRKLLEKLLEIAEEKNLQKISLTSNPKRIAARALYQSLGFEKRDTDVFVKELV